MKKSVTNLFGNALVIVEGIKYLSFAVGGLANEGRGGEGKISFRAGGEKRFLIALNIVLSKKLYSKTTPNTIQNNTK